MKEKTNRKEDTVSLRGTRLSVMKQSSMTVNKGCASATDGCRTTRIEKD